LESSEVNQTKSTLSRCSVRIIIFPDRLRNVCVLDLRLVNLTIYYIYIYIFSWYNDVLYFESGSWILIASLLCILYFFNGISDLVAC